MRHIETDILVIGGGATGTGILRDLAMRGFKCLLVERRDLAYGTTGRYHGLLHSGARYAVKDPLTAKECIEENRILRHIMPQCIEDTGGFCVLTPGDDPQYVQKFLEGCRIAGIPVESIEIRQMLKEEPLLDPNILQCYRVPDASADSFLAADLNTESARQHGAMILTYHDITGFSTSSQHSGNGSSVTGVLCHDLVKDENLQIDASMVINASGAWAGKIASMAGISLQMLPGKGTMVAVNQRIVNTVINRCRLPSDGDGLVPAHSVTIMGTTDVRVADPDHYGIEPWEIRLMLEAGEKIIPRFKEFRILRTWAGIRPLIQETASDNDRDVSRAFTLLDHAEREGIEGFITITSGKWTTYRKMAQAVVDKVCQKLNTSRSCRTHLEELPYQGKDSSPRLYLGARLEKIEQEASYGQLVCECELAMREEIEKAIVLSDAQTIDDIRRDVRLGMGPCQGAFCVLRVTGMLHSLRHAPVEKTNVSLRDFLQERYKGIMPVLWGHQLQQERFNELIYIDLLNAPSLPGDASSILSTQNYSAPSEIDDQKLVTHLPTVEKSSAHGNNQPVDVIVIGAGLSGLITGWRLSANGKKTRILTRGWGATYWSSGCIDVKGYQPPDFTCRLDSPGDYLEEFIASHPEHPYALIGLDELEEALQSFQQLTAASGYPYHGSIHRNYLLPTSLGTLRPTCLVPMTMLSGDAHLSTPMLITGFSQFLDFNPTLIADNLNAQALLAREISLDLKSLRSRKFITGMLLANLFDEPDFRQEVVDALKPKLGNAGRVGFPAVLGIRHSAEVINYLEAAFGIPVFEITGLPPSIPGIRLHNMLVSAIESYQGMVNNGMSVSNASVEGNWITAIWSEAAARNLSHHANNYVLATGGILGGGIQTTECGYAQEMIFNIPIVVPNNRTQWFHDTFLSPESHPIHTSGVLVDQDLHPVDRSGRIIYQNLFATGSLLGNCDPIRERSLDGIALASGYKIGECLSAGDLP